MIRPEVPIFELDDHPLSLSGANLAEADTLYKAGFLSFNPAVRSEFQRADIQELAFVKKLYFDSGFDAKTVLVMFNKLEKPYRYSFDKIYWDLGSRGWKEIKQA